MHNSRRAHLADRRRPGARPRLAGRAEVDGLSGEWLRRVADAPHTPDVKQFDCVLLDLSLPDGSGLDLLHRWRRGGNSLPVIVITARSAMKDRLAGLDGGADDFVIKPFAAVEPISRIRQQHGPIAALVVDDAVS